MKKLIIILLILTFPIFVKADLTKEQQDDIAAFAKNMIIKGNGSEHKNGKFGILAYDQGKRTDGFYGRLAYLYKDYNSVNPIQANKWVFDCSSFAAYVYYHCFGVNTTYSSNKYPYVVSTFVDNASKKKDFYFIMNGVSVANLDYSKLQKGDLIIQVGVHIMVYIGDGKIAHFSSSAIVKDQNLGCEVVSLQSKYPNMKVSVIRLKDGVISKTKKANMTITWPDTGKTEDLSDKDDLPKINVSYNDTITQEVEVTINITDDKGLTGYQITTGSPTSYQSISNKKSFSTKYKVTKNGTYYVYAKDTKGQTTNYQFKVTKIDNTKPEITSVGYKYNRIQNNFDIEVTATDTNTITYALDSDNYQDSNKFSGVSIGSHIIKVKDVANNIIEYTLNLSNDLIPTINLNYDTSYTKSLKVSIVAVDTNGISGYNVTTSDIEPSSFLPYSNGQTYNISTNGTYYFWVRNTKGVVVNKSIVVNNIDAVGPTVNNVKIKKTFNGFDIDIDAVDNQCGMGTYSIDGINYQNENHFEKVDTIYENIYIKDKCDNVTTYKVDFDSIEDDNIGTIILIAVIAFVVIITAYNLLSIKKKRH